MDYLFTYLSSPVNLALQTVNWTQIRPDKSPVDTLMVFLKSFSEKVDFEKSAGKAFLKTPGDCL